MARRGEITGCKPRVTADRAKRRKVPRTDSLNVEVDSDAVEPATHSEPGGNECADTPPIRGPPIPPAVFTIATFCAAHHISEAFYFKLKNQSLGPREMRLGSRIFITFEAAAAWRAEREAATAAA